MRIGEGGADPTGRRPGQIGTVTTSNPALWQGHPAPVRTRGDRPPRRRRHSAHGRQLLARVRLCRGSRRCKSSHRSATALAGHREIELLQVPATGEPNNPSMLVALADRSDALLGATPRTTDTGQRPLEPADIAVVVSHNAQTSVVHAQLRGRDIDGVTVGTPTACRSGSAPPWWLSTR